MAASTLVGEEHGCTMLFVEAELLLVLQVEFEPN